MLTLGNSGDLAEGDAEEGKGSLGERSQLCLLRVLFGECLLILKMNTVALNIENKYRGLPSRCSQQ